MLKTTDRTWREAVVAWWANDLPPVSGRLRAVFYGGLLYFALTGYSPLTLATMFAEVSPAVRHPMPLLHLVGVDNPPAMVVLLVRDLCLAAWICATVGFLTRPAKMATAATALYLHGLGMSVVPAHGWFVPVYSLGFMALAASDDTFSIDSVIRRRFPTWQASTRRAAPIFKSGLPRKLVAVFTIYSLFAGGVAKLMEGGLSWIDGRSLQSYIILSRQLYGESLPRFPRVASLVTSNLPLAAALSVASLLLELASPIALWTRRLRHLIVAGAVMFHVAIYMTMLPDFFAQLWCYILIVDWRALLPSRHGVPFPMPTVWQVSDRRTVAAVTSATLFSIFLLAVIAFRVEKWPVTYVPMYGSYVSDTIVSGVPRSAFRTAGGMSTIVGLADANQLPWVSGWMFWYQMDVVLRSGEQSLSVKRALDGPAPPFRFSWEHLLREVVLQEFRNRQRSADAAADRTFDTPGILTVIAGRARALRVRVEDYETIELVYQLDEGQVVLARAAIDPESDSP